MNRPSLECGRKDLVNAEGKSFFLPLVMIDEYSSLQIFSVDAKGNFDQARVIIAMSSPGTPTVPE